MRCYDDAAAARKGVCRDGCGIGGDEKGVYGDGEFWAEGGVGETFL